MQQATMQRKASVKQPTIVTQAQLARELDAAPSTISRLVAKGLAVRRDGRLNRTQALLHISRQTSGHGAGWAQTTRGKDGLQERAQRLLDGSPKAATTATGPAAPKQQTATDEERRFFFERGQMSAAHSLCASVRTSLLPILAAMDLPGIKSADEGFRLRVGLGCLVDWLMRGWCEEFVKPEELPAIDWKQLFGPAAKPAKAWFEALPAYWQANTEDETVSMWPPNFMGDWPGDDIPMPEARPSGKPKAAKKGKR